MGEPNKTPTLEEKMDETLEIMGEVSKRVDDFEKGLTSSEAFRGEVNALIENALEGERERIAAESRERDLSFDAEDVGIKADDKVSHKLARVLSARNAQEKNEAALFALSYESDNPNINRLKELNDALAIEHALFTTAHSHGKLVYGGMHTLRDYDEFVSLRDSVMGSVKASHATSNTGDWVPTGMSSQVARMPIIEGNVEALFKHVDCPTKVYDYPVMLTPASTLPTVVAESTGGTYPISDTTTQNLVDGKVTFTAVMHRGRCVTSVGLEEDAILSVVDEIKGELSTMSFRGLEYAICNGDESATHMDTDLEAAGATHVAQNHYGLRYYGLNSTGTHSVDISAGTYEAIIGIRKLMGGYGANPSALAWIVGPKTAIDLLVLKDAGSNLVMKTDNLGAVLPSTPGAIGTIAGSPVVVSEHWREDLNNSGVDDGITATDTTIACVNRSCYMVGDRRALTIAGEYWATSDQILLVGFRRCDFQSVFKTDETDNGAHVTCAIGYNKTT